MSYSVQFSKQSAKELKKLDRVAQTYIIHWIEKNLIDCENPRQHGKALVGDKSGLWRYRVGDYRLLCEIHDNILTVLVVKIAHRKEVYM